MTEPKANQAGQAGRESSSNEPEEARPHREPSPDMLERLVSWISALLILCAIAFLIWEGVSGTTPAAFELEISRIRIAGGQYYVSLKVRNTGGASVQNLGLRVDLQEGDQAIATSRTQLAWMPGHSEREAVVIFRHDPRRYQMEIHLEGYEPP